MCKFCNRFNCFADYDGILLSNGPGDPAQYSSISAKLNKILKSKHVHPIFGICLGHQILARSIGAKTKKLKFGFFIFSNA